MSDEVVARYAARLLQLKAERDSIDDDDVLAAVARDLGMSDADMAAVNAAVAAHVDRGNGYVAHGRVADAVAEFDAAAALAPRDVAVLHALASVLQKRNGDGDAHRARTLSKRVLAIDAKHQPSFALLNALDKKKSWAPAVAVLALAAAAVPFLIVGAVIVDRDHIPAMKMREKKKPVVDVTAPASEIAVPAVADDTGKFDLPLTLIADGNSEGLALDVRSSVLSRYDDSAFYDLRVVVTSSRDAVIKELDWRIDLKDKDGVVVATAKKSAPSDYEASLRKRDAVAFAHLLPTPKSAQTATLTVTRTSQEPRPASEGAASSSSFPPSKPITLHGDMPTGVSVAVRERAASLSPESLGIGPFYEATWEVENTGASSIEDLKLALRAYDASGQQLEVKSLIGDGSFYVTSSASMASIRAGEVRLVRVTKQVPKTTQKTELWVAP